MANGLDSLGRWCHLQPSNNYEKFVERYFQKNGSLARGILKAAQSEWYANDDSLFLQMPTFIAMFVCLENIK